MEEYKSGKCCSCKNENETVRNIIALDKKIPDEHLPGGWGCFVCGLDASGAVAVLCDKCLDTKKEIKFACLGYPKENRRIEIEKLRTSFKHDRAKHPELQMQDSDEQDFIFCQNCQKIVAVVEGNCSICGEEICLHCGCTDSEPCLEGCRWVVPNVCSECFTQPAKEDLIGVF